MSAQEEILAEQRHYQKENHDMEFHSKIKRAVATRKKLLGAKNNQKYLIMVSFISFPFNIHILIGKQPS